MGYVFALIPLRCLDVRRANATAAVRVTRLRFSGMAVLVVVIMLLELTAVELADVVRVIWLGGCATAYAAAARTISLVLSE